MSHATLRNGHPAQDASPSMGENVVNLACDLMTLAELQIKLVGLDLSDASRDAKKPTIAIAAAGCVFLGAVPVFLLALGGLLSEWTQLSQPVSHLFVAAVALLAAAITTWWGLGKLSQASRVLLRSQAEFQENLAWIKKAVQQTSK